MKQLGIVAMLILCVGTVICGCSASKAQRTGFLSDYSKLKPQW